MPNDTESVGQFMTNLDNGATLLSWVLLEILTSFSDVSIISSGSFISERFSITFLLSEALMNILLPDC